jgi:hypothetical protein
VASDGVITVELRRGATGFAELSDSWELLARQLPRPRFCHSYGWWCAYINHLEPNPDSIFFFLFRDNQGILAILPVQHRVVRRFGVPVRELGFPNHPHIPLNDLLYRADANVAAIMTRWRHALQKEFRIGWDTITLGGLLEESPLVRHGKPQIIAPNAMPACDYLIRGNSYDEMLERFSANFRGNLRKSRNRLAKEPRVQMISVSDRAELDVYFEHFLRLEAGGWKGDIGQGTAIALHPRLKAFYGALIRELAPRGEVCINAMRIEDQVVAAQFCVRDHDTIYLLKIAYDEAWSRHSPGNMLLEHVIRNAIDTGRYRYINLVTDTSWHRDWRPEHYNVWRAHWFNTTPAGMLERSTEVARRQLKPLYRRLVANR